MKIAIVGAGLTGLVAGYRLSQKGHKVTIFEKSADVGGLAGGFEIGGTSLEKAYHHIFTTDKYIIELVEELGLTDKLKWYPEKTALYYDKTIYPFMGAMDLLKFKPLGFLDKVRLGLVKIWLEKNNNWQKYENQSAYEWMNKWCGKRAYKVIWEPLLRGKFHEKYKEVSMAWLWARIHTRGNSGKLGYFTGGFNIISQELAKRIKENGGKILLNHKLLITNYELLINNEELKKFDKVLYTGPSKEVEYLGAVCLVFTSKQSLSKFYWHNINDTKSPFLCFIQHTNLIDKNNYGGKNVYYLGVYVPHEHRNFGEKEELIVGEWFDYLKKIVPTFDKKMVEDKWLFRLKNAQHIVSSKYKVPSAKLGKNIFQANFAMIYPEDRGTNFAVREGEKIAKILNSKETINW
ncbi:NAD(P)/FAD-dependent oxidoreductase [Candidatus Shapirobacteria bacterium]|nr:NAD(P)/FAD-dependent oxidoreductase [Candidatus Shapirobacteria bacterium]